MRSTPISASKGRNARSANSFPKRKEAPDRAEKSIFQGRLDSGRDSSQEPSSPLISKKRTDGGLIRRPPERSGIKYELPAQTDTDGCERTIEVPIVGTTYVDTTVYRTKEKVPSIAKCDFGIGISE